jgi:hypothetical protein
MDIKTGEDASKQAGRKKGGQYLYQLQSKVVRKPPPNSILLM